MKSRNQGLKLYTFVIAVPLVAVSTAQLSSIGLSNGTVVYAYSNSQAQSFVNECRIDGLTNLNCANNGPLMQGEGIASSPIVTQSAGRQQEPSEPPVTPPTEPQPDTCEKCIRNVLTDEEQTELMELFNRLPLPGGPGGGGAGKPVEIIEELCDRIAQSPSPFDTIQSIEELLGPGTDSIPGMNLEQDRIDELINCLKAVFNV